MTVDLAVQRANTSARLALTQLAKRLQAEMDALVAVLDSTSGTLDSTRYNLNQVAQIRSQVLEVANTRGIADVVGQFRAELPSIVRETLRDFPELGQFAPEITGDLMRVLEGQQDDIARVLSSVAADEIGDAVSASVTGALDLSDATKAVADAIDTTLGRAAVTIDRAVRDFHETTLSAQAANASELLPEGEEFIFLYSGPSDSITRPYCAARVGRYLTSSQVADLDPTERYNCRHRPIPVLLSEAAEEGPVQRFTG